MSEFNIMDVVHGFDSGDDDAAIKELFSQEVPSSEISENKVPVETSLQEDKTPIDPDNAQPNNPKKLWMPEEELMEGMDELQASPVTYTKEELVVEDDGLKNIADEKAIEGSLDSMNELARQNFNINAVKKRHGIELKIPDGYIKVAILNAAANVDFEKAQAELDIVIEELRTTYPECVIDIKREKKSVSEQREEDAEQPPEDTCEPVHENGEEGITDDNSNMLNFNEHKVGIQIDKTNVPQVAWTEEEIDKIKKAHIIELKIKETDSIEFSEIEDIEDENEVDKVLSLYTRKTNDIESPLPASNYRATFTGLSYPELLDLLNYQTLDNIDSEYQKWTIAFHHMKNPSIGPWKEYKIYKDPSTKREIKMNMDDPIPEGIDPNAIHTVSKFEDFLRKTSIFDLGFILWKIVCATLKGEKEILTIHCNQKLKNGQLCGNSYDWLYNPNELLLVSEMDPAVLLDMEKSTTVSGFDHILAHYKTSLVVKKNLVKLNQSGFQLVFGHLSAYEYLEKVYPYKKEEQTNLSEKLNLEALMIIKGFVIPKSTGDGYYRVTHPNKILKILNELDEIDWLTVSEILNLVKSPYEFNFAVRDVLCPKCKQRETIPIEDISDLLFTIAQSLSIVQIELKSDCD